MSFLQPMWLLLNRVLIIFWQMWMHFHVFAIIWENFNSVLLNYVKQRLDVGTYEQRRITISQRMSLEKKEEKIDDIFSIHQTLFICKLDFYNKKKKVRNINYNHWIIFLINNLHYEKISVDQSIICSKINYQ